MDPLAKNIAFVLLFTLIGGLFSASEMALVSLRQTQIDEMAKGGGTGLAVKRLTEDPNRFLSAVQVGVTIAGFFSASFGASNIAPEVAPVFEGWGMSTSGAATLAFVLVTIAIAYLSIVFGELVPKRLALQSAQAIARVVARPLAAVTALLRPVIWFLGVSTNVVLRLFGRNPRTPKDTMGVAELRAFVASQEEIGREEREMVVDMLSVGDRTVEEIMTPRTEVDFLSAEMTIGQARREVSRLDHSRYPVRQGTSDDDILGFIHIRDLIAPVDEGGAVGDLVREILMFPTGKPVMDALAEMRARHAHLAVVVDEYGGTDGIITVEDVVEEFVGEIRDEYDRELPVEIKRGDLREIDALASRAEVAKAFGIPLPDGPFDTIGGFVINELGRMPEVGDEVRWGAHLLRVESLEGRRIAWLRVTEAPESAADGEEK
ncbi:MAG: hemolysin family protein [Actinomycetaceae bacterium]|nr:hemolysin family protein [Actinomycetaceae bacterium]